MKRFDRPTLLLLATTAIWLGLLFVTHPDYGVTWDEPFWFAFGETQRQWVTSTDPTLPLTDPSDLFFYGALPSLIAATGRWLLHDTWSLLPAPAAWHAANLGFAVVLGAGVLFWSYRTIGTRGAVWAMLLWCAWPRLWPDWHNNISDLPGAALSIWAAWAAWRCVDDPADRWWNYIRMGALLALAYACRAPNVYFLVGLLGVWLVWLRLSGRAWPRRAVVGTILAIGVFVLVLKAVSPPFWQRSVLEQILYLNPKAYMGGAVGKTSVWFNGAFYGGDAVPRYYAPLIFFLGTPVAVLFLLFSATARAIANLRSMPTFVSLWLILGFGSIAKHLTGSGNYDGVRHFLEAYAPLTLLAAWGVEQWWARRSERGWKRIEIVGVGIVTASLVGALTTAVRIHPYQTGYFNVFAGRVESAWERFEFDYWGLGVTDASTWLVRQNNGQPVRVFTPLMSHLIDWTLPANFTVTEVPNPQELDAAQPGDWLVIPSRKGKLIVKKFEYACPPQWLPAYEVPTASGLPPSVRVCRR